MAIRDASKMKATRSVIRPLRLKSNIAWSLSENIAYGAFRWGTLVLLARIGSAEIVGQLILATAICTPINVLTSLDLRLVVASDQRSQYSFADYVAIRIAAAAIALSAIGLIVYLAGYHPLTAAVIFLFGLGQVLQGASDVIYGLLQRHERMDHVARSRFLREPLLLLATVTGVYISGELVVGVAALALVQLAVLTLYDLPCAQWVQGMHGENMRPRWNVRTAAGLAWIVIPAGAVAAMVTLYSSIPRFYAERILGVRDLALFGTMAYFIVIGSTIVGAVLNSVVPRMARHYADGESGQLARILICLLAICISIGTLSTVGAVAAGKQLLEFVYSSKYAEHHELFAWVTVSMGIALTGGVFRTCLRAIRCYRPLLINTTICLIAALLSASHLITEYGIAGAIWVFLIISAIDAVLNGIAVLVAVLACRSRTTPKAAEDPGGTVLHADPPAGRRRLVLSAPLS